MWLLYHFIRFEFILKVTHFLFVQLIRTIKEFEPPAFDINNRFINSKKSDIHLEFSLQNSHWANNLYSRNFCIKMSDLWIIHWKAMIHVKFILWLHEVMYCTVYTCDSHLIFTLFTNPIKPKTATKNIHTGFFKCNLSSNSHEMKPLESN